MKAHLYFIFIKLYSPRALFRGFFLFFTLFCHFSYGFENAVCDTLQPWFEIKAKIISKSISLQQRVQLQSAEFEIRQKIAQDSFRSYLNGSLANVHFADCLAGEPDRLNFLNTVQGTFYDSSIAILRKAHSRQIQRLVKILDQRLGGQEMLFRMINHYEPVPDLVYKAGFYRDSRSLFMNTDKIPGSEWLLIFIHELVHSLDETLWSSMEIYAREDWVRKFVQSAKRIEDPVLLPSDERRELTVWLKSGLDRGLWAEYRAWLITFSIYSEGLKENMWGSIPWAESILAQKPVRMDLPHFIYLYLDQNFPDPDTNIFSIPLVKEALALLRAQYRAPGAPTPPLENLEVIIAPPK